MSTKYEISEYVPSNIICDRLEALSDAVTKGSKSILREFYMSIPAQVDHDADLILSAASQRIKKLEDKISNLKQYAVCDCQGCLAIDDL